MVALYQAFKASISGATGQGTRTSTANPAEHGSPPETAKADLNLGIWADKLRLGGTSEAAGTSTTWIGDGSALDRDIKALLDGRLTQQEYRDRFTVRGAGAAIGLTLDAAVLGGVLALGSAAEGTGLIGLSQQTAARVASAGAGAGAGAVAMGPGAAGPGEFVRKVINSFMPHAAERAVERAGFQSIQEARVALQQFGARSSGLEWCHLRQSAIQHTLIASSSRGLDGAARSSIR